MQPSSFERKLFPVLLITVGGVVILAVFSYMFRAQPWLGWALIGLLAISVGVIGIVVNYTHAPAHTHAAPADPSPAPPETPPYSATAPGKSAARVAGEPPPQPQSVSVSKPILIGGLLLGSSAVLLLCNLGVASLPLLTVRETQIVDCSAAEMHSESGWRVVSTYTYAVADAEAAAALPADTIVYNKCVLERERFILAREKQPIPAEIALESTLELAVSNEATPTLALDFTLATATLAPGVTPTQTSAPPATAPPTSTSLPPATNTPFPTQIPLSSRTPRPPATHTPFPTRFLSPTPLPSPTLRPPAINTPFPTRFLSPTPRFLATNTPLLSPTAPALSPTPTPVPRRDLEVCKVELEDMYLNTYIQWEGRIMDSLITAEGELLLQVE